MESIPQEIVDRIKSRGKLPRHIGIIMDGNGRWAERRGLPRTAGHNAGVETVRRIVEAAGQLGISVLTLYTFSCENWRRPANEVSALMNLLLKTIRKEIDDLEKKNVRLTVIGDIKGLPYAPRAAIEGSIRRLEKNTGLVLNLALNYGGRQEIVQAVKALGNDILAGKITPESINEAIFASYLQTSELGDPDLVIRTSGEKRISNFLLWQIAYSELYITPTLWPDFTAEEFCQAIEDFQNRERRFGGIGHGSF
ncbi:MAG: isoprenyl transferase [candidate division KSB1 bacterium]|nr:isoprenyl transferase [candidate division KSB1 bacterium]